MRALISVIIPFYTNIKWLSEAINSILDQTYSNYEIIVVNDGSPEEDTLFLEYYGKEIKYFKTDNKGPAAARNKGIEIAKGEYIAFLDSDDLWEPDKLETQQKFIQSNNLVWSHTGYSLFDDFSGKKIREIEINNFSGDVFLSCLVSSPIATPCIMIKRKFLMSHPEIRFDEQMRFGQDSLMWLKIAYYENLGVVPQSLSKVRIRGGNAALRARVYLLVKSQVWDFIKLKIKLGDEKYKKIPFLIRCVYRSCAINNGVINFFDLKFDLKEETLELFSKVLYFPSYFMLKCYKYFKIYFLRKL